MSELLKNQKFGVEVEFTGITRSMAARAVHSIVGGSVTGPRSDAYQGAALYFLRIEYVSRIPNNQHINLLKIRKNRINLRFHIVQNRIHEWSCLHFFRSFFKISGI